MKALRVVLWGVFFAILGFGGYSCMRRTKLLIEYNQLHKVIWDKLTEEKEKKPFPDQASVQALVREETGFLTARPSGSSYQLRFDLKIWSPQNVVYVIHHSGADGIFDTSDDDLDEFVLGVYPFVQ